MHVHVHEHVHVHVHVRIMHATAPCSAAWLADYLVLVRKLARLCGWYKADHALAAELNQSFPTNHPTSMSAGAGGTVSLVRQVDSLVEFASSVAPQLFAADVGGAAPMAQFKAQFVHMLELQPRFLEYLGSNPDYMAWTHPNLNIDNAYWWRDESGALDAGVIDWAGVGCREVTMSLDMCLFGGGWEVQEGGGQRELLAAFRDEYVASGGPALDLEELQRHFDVTLAIQLGGMTGIPAQLYGPHRIPRDQWPAIESVRDPRIDGDDDRAFIVRSYVRIVIYRLTRWRRDGVYARLCAWAGVPPAPGT